VVTWDIRLRASSDLIELLYQRAMKDRNKSHRAEGFTTADAIPIFDALVQRIAAVAAQNGARLVAVLAYAPEGFGGDFTEKGRLMTESLNRAGVPSLDTRKLFAARSSDPNRLLYSSVGMHWNPQGHAIVADGIQELLGRTGVH